MKNKYEARLDTERMLPLVFKMALPAVAAQFANLFYDTVDRICIGYTPGIGINALADTGVTISIMILISFFSIIVGVDGPLLAAIAPGQGDRERTGKIVGNGFILLILFTIFASFIIYIFVELILLFTGASKYTLGYAVGYLSTYLLDTLFVEMPTGSNVSINAQGRPSIAMRSVLTGTLLNIVLDPIFIFWLDMGVKGTAPATILSQTYSAIWVLNSLFPRHASLPLKGRYMRPDRGIIPPIFALGISSFIMISTESLVGFILNSSLKNFGNIYMSTLAILRGAIQFISVPLIGFIQGSAPIISYNYGHGDKQRMKDCLRIVLIVMFSPNSILALFMILFSSTVASAFTSDEELTDTVRWVMPIPLAGMTIFGLQRAYQNAFAALGQAKISTFIILFRKVIPLIPSALLSPHFMGVTGVYAAEAASDTTAVICCTLLFIRKFPKILGKIKKKEERAAQ